MLVFQVSFFFIWADFIGFEEGGIGFRFRMLEGEVLGSVGVGIASGVVTSQRGGTHWKGGRDFVAGCFSCVEVWIL